MHTRFFLFAAANPRHEKIIIDWKRARPRLATDGAFLGKYYLVQNNNVTVDEPITFQSKIRHRLRGEKTVLHCVWSFLSFSPWYSLSLRQQPPTRPENINTVSINKQTRRIVYHFSPHDVLKEYFPGKGNVLNYKVFHN